MPPKQIKSADEDLIFAQSTRGVLMYLSVYVSTYSFLSEMNALNGLNTLNGLNGLNTLNGLNALNVLNVS